jgi:Ca-activated chloride channel family protein
MPAEARHAIPPQRGRRLPRRLLRSRVLVIGAALALAAGGVVVAQFVGASTGCDPHRPQLQVVAAPDIAPAVSRIAAGVLDPGGCSQVQVRAEAPSDVLTALQASSAEPSDVWIPDSSLWVGHARDDQLITPAGQESIASSPLVLALPRALQDQGADAKAAPAWQDVLGALSTGQLVLHVDGEATSPSTAGVLVALQKAAEQRPEARAFLAGVLRGAQVGGEVGGSGQALHALSSSAGSAVPVAEQAVFSYTRSEGASKIAAVYPEGAGTPFDYPFTVLHAGGGPRGTADRLLGALRSADGQALLRAEGFRGVDGVGDGLTADRGVDGTRPSTVALPDIATVERLLDTLDAVHRDARVLAVVDVSGSMAAPVPGAHGNSRLGVALQAAAAGLQFYPDTTEVGLWAFSEKMSGTTDHQELVPLALLTAPAPGGRPAMKQAMTQLRAIPNGGTGLYDTTLAAVRAVRAGWDPDRVNVVVLLTDGDDTDDDGIGLDQLLRTLRSEGASGKPVPVITIAYGDSAGVKSLAAISAATGGAAYQASEPSRIRDIFLDAVAQRACRPNC